MDVNLDGASLDRVAGLLLPSMFVYAEYEEPEDQRRCPEEPEGCNVEEQTVSERRIQEGKPTYTRNHRQHAQDSGQEGGLDDEVACQDCIESEKCQRDTGAPVIHPFRKRSASACSCSELNTLK